MRDLFANSEHHIRVEHKTYNSDTNKTITTVMYFYGKSEEEVIKEREFVKNIYSEIKKGYNNMYQN